MKRYLLFTFDTGYESQSDPKGWDAFEGDFDSIEEARACAVKDAELPLDWEGVNHPTWDYHIVDSETKTIVEDIKSAVGAGVIPVFRHEPGIKYVYTGASHLPSVVP